MVLDAAEKTGKNAEGIVPACFQMINVSKSKEDSFKKVGKLLAPTGLWWKRSLKLGYGTFNSPSEVPRDVIEKLNILGNTRDCANMIGEFIDAGVEHLILQPVPVNEQQQIISQLADTIKSI